MLDVVVDIILKVEKIVNVFLVFLFLIYKLDSLKFFFFFRGFCSHKIIQHTWWGHNICFIIV